MAVTDRPEAVNRSGYSESGTIVPDDPAKPASSTSEVSPSVRSLLAQFPEVATPTAGELAAEILRTHGRGAVDLYLDEAAANMTASSNLREHETAGRPRHITRRSVRFGARTYEC